MVTSELGLADASWWHYLMLLFFLGVLVYEIKHFLAAKASHHWLNLDAVVDKVFIDERENEGTLESLPRIEYRYHYKGRHYQGKRIQYGQLWSEDYGESCKHIRNLKKGSLINIKVNPNKPSQSTVNPGYSGEITLMVVLLVAVVFIFFGLVTH